MLLLKGSIGCWIEVLWLQSELYSNTQCLSEGAFITLFSKYQYSVQNWYINLKLHNIPFDILLIWSWYLYLGLGLYSPFFPWDAFSIDGSEMMWNNESKCERIFTPNFVPQKTFLKKRDIFSIQMDNNININCNMNINCV